MRPIEYWLLAYQKSHRHPINIIIHKICVPIIVCSIFGLLWSLPTPQLPAIPWWINWATAPSILVVFFYVRLSKKLALGMALWFCCLTFLYRWLDSTLSIPFWLPLCGIFIGAWVLQFIGHALEGKKPSFLQDLIFLLIGPLWVLVPLYTKLGITISSSRIT